MRSHEPHHDVLTSPALEFVAVLCDLSSVIVLQCYGFQFHQDRVPEFILEQQIEPPDVGKRLLTANQHEVLPGEKVIRIRGNDVLHVPLNHQRLPPRDPQLAGLCKEIYHRVPHPSFFCLGGNRPTNHSLTSPSASGLVPHPSRLLLARGWEAIVPCRSSVADRAGQEKHIIRSTPFCATQITRPCDRLH